MGQARRGRGASTLEKQKNRAAKKDRQVPGSILRRTQKLDEAVSFAAGACDGHVVGAYRTTCSSSDAILLLWTAHLGRV